MNESLEALGARIELAAFRLGRGEVLREQELTALAEEATALAPSLDEDSRSWLSGRVAKIISALDTACADLDARMRTFGRGRRAARSYVVAGASFGA